MALHFSSVCYNKDEFVKRIDAKYYHLQEELKNFKSNEGYEMCDFEEVIKSR